MKYELDARDIKLLKQALKFARPTESFYISFRKEENNVDVYMEIGTENGFIGEGDTIADALVNALQGQDW